jgi:hypothetical protein
MEDHGESPFDETDEENDTAQRADDLKFAETVAQVRTMLEEIRRNLKPGGPPVDCRLLHLYIEEALSKRELDIVRERLVTWKAWSDGYWRAVLAVDSKEDR